MTMMISRRRRPLLLAALTAGLCVPLGLQAQEVLAPETDVLPGVIGEAPIAAGNAASARERALEEAFRQLVEKTFAQLLSEQGVATPTAAQAGVRAAWLQRPRRLVRGYKVLEESEQAGNLRVRVTAELDEAGMRRELERARGGSPTARSVPAGAVPVVAMSSPEAAAAVAAALAGGGVRAELAPGRLADPAAVRPLALKSGRGVAAAVTGREQDEGLVRGAGLRAYACEISVQLVPAVGDATSPARVAKARGFHADALRARDNCYVRATAALLPVLLPDLGGLTSGAGDLRQYVLDLDLNEPAALSPVLRAVRKVAGAAAAEVRRIAVGRVELAVSTRLASAALFAGIARELGSVATLVRTGPDRGDRIMAQVRLLAPVEPAPPPAPGALSPPAGAPPTGAAAPAGAPLPPTVAR
jgi:hypothetical protein